MKKGISSKQNLLITILYTLVMFPLLGENIISTILGDDVSKLFSVFSCGVILLIIFKKRKIIFNKFFIVMLLLIILRIIILFELAPQNLSITATNNMITPYGLIGYFMLFLFIENNIDDKNKIKLIFKSMMLIMTISVVLNFILTGDLHVANNIAVFKEAISTGYTNSRSWLFGHRNMIFIHHLMWILVSYVYYYLINKDFKKVLKWEMLFTLLVGVVSWNSTMLLTTVIVYVLLTCRNTIFKKVNIIHFILIYLFLEIGIVFFRIQDIFSFIIVGILNRNLTFTGRTYIWNDYIEQFKNSNMIHKLLGNYGIAANVVNTHNMFLGLLAFTGIIGLVLYFYIFYMSIKRLKNNYKSDKARFVSIIIFGFLMNALTMEFYIQPLLAIYIGYKIAYLKNEEEE